MGSIYQKLSRLNTKYSVSSIETKFGYSLVLLHCNIDIVIYNCNIVFFTCRGFQLNLPIVKSIIPVILISSRPALDHPVNNLSVQLYGKQQAFSFTLVGNEVSTHFNNECYMLLYLVSLY